MRHRTNILLAWDALVWTLGVATFFTGGFIWQSPWGKIELNQVGLHCLALTLIALLLAKMKLAWRDVSSIRFIEKCWRYWNEGIQKNPIRFLFGGILIIGIFWALLSTRRHFAFQSNAADLGIFTNAAWNFVNGHGYFSSVKGGISLLADHQSPILLLFFPIYSLYPFAENLLWQQAFFWAATAFPIYYLAKHFLGSHSIYPSLLPLLFWIYAPARNTVLFDFHPEILMLPLFLSAAVCFLHSDKRVFVLGIIFFLLALCCKESAAPIGVAMAISLFFWNRARWPLSLILILLSISSFLINFYFIPSWLQTSQAYVGSYAGLGGSIFEILLSPITKPYVFFSRLLAWNRIQFFSSALLPLLFLPLLSWRLFFTAIPGFAMLFLSVGDHRITTGYHYILEPAVGIWLALPAAIAWLIQRKPNLQKNLPLALILASIFLYGRSDFWRFREFSATSAQTWLRTSALPCISQLPLAADNAIVPHLANRHWVAYIPEFSLLQEGSVSCLVRDERVNRWPLDSNLERKVAEKISMEYRLHYQCGSFSVYEKKGGGSTCMKCIPDCYEKNIR